jgi:hypothetical protein
MVEIHVKCYSGYRSDERPLRFVLGGTPLDVKELDGRWYSSGVTFFYVIASDRNFYALRHEEAPNLWTLDGFRAAHRWSRTSTSNLVN